MFATSDSVVKQPRLFHEWSCRVSLHSSCVVMTTSLFFFILLFRIRSMIKYSDSHKRNGPPRFCWVDVFSITTMQRSGFLLLSECLWVYIRVDVRLASAWKVGGRLICIPCVTVYPLQVLAWWIWNMAGLKMWTIQVVWKIKMKA
jgi:hypothetical protein